MWFNIGKLWNETLYLLYSAITRRSPAFLLLDKNHQNVLSHSMLFWRECSKSQRFKFKNNYPETSFLWSSSNNSFTPSAFFWHEGIVKDTGSVVGRRGDSAWGDSVGELAQAHCHCWRRGKAGELGDRCWMWKPVWLISNRVEGGGTLLCLAGSLHPTQSVGEGSSGLQPGWTMKALQA